MPFTYDAIPNYETTEEKASRENREMRVRADYEDMINAALNAIPMKQESDFRTAVNDLEKILRVTIDGGTPDFDPALKASMETVYEYITLSELFVEDAANYFEYQEIIAIQIHTRIARFNSLSREEKNRYIVNQKTMHEKATQHKATAVAGESKRAEHATHMSTEEEVLVQEEVLAQTFGDAAPSPVFFQPAVVDIVAQRNLRPEELYRLLEENIDTQAQILRDIARELPDLLGNSAHSFLQVMERAHSDNKQIIIDALGDYSGIVEKFLGNQTSTQQLVDVMRAVTKTHWQQIFALVAHKMNELIPDQNAFRYLSYCFICAPQQPAENLIYFSRAFGLSAMGKWIEICSKLGGEYAQNAHDLMFVCYRTHDTAFIEDLLSSFTDDVVGALYGGPSGAAKIEYIFYSLTANMVQRESNVAFFTGLGNDRLNAIINSCDNETIKNTLKNRIKTAGIELHSPGLNRR